MRIALTDIVVPPGRRAAQNVDELAAGIEDVGLINPVSVVRVDGDFRLVAGRNRLAAAGKLGWSDIEVCVLPIEGVKVRFAELQENLFRTDLDALEKAEAQKECKDIHEALHPETRTGGAPVKRGAGGKAGKTKRENKTAESATLFLGEGAGQAQRTVRENIQIAEGITPDVKEKIAAPQHPAHVLVDRKTDLLELAGLPAEQQRDFVEKIAAVPEDEMRKVRGGVKSLRSALRTAKQASRRSDAAKTAAVTGKFTVIVADPPWTYAGGGPISTGSPDQHYACMTTDEICAMPIRDVATKDAVLFLWATNPLLFSDAPRVLDAWGFKYKTNLVWVKDKATTGLGIYFRGQHEILLGAVCDEDHQFLLTATRGSFVPRKSDRPRSVLMAPRRGHSEKPDEAIALIEKMYPGQKYLELFGRKLRPGWTVWGNEVGSTEGLAGGGKVGERR